MNDGNGCIYLGIISDLTTGPFAALGVPLTAAQRDFWNEVNEDGGLDGFDVIIRDEDVIDAHYNAEDHAAGYEQIRGRVLALAQTLGTPQTQGILDRMAEDNVVGAPATWWSGWNFAEEGGDLILESGASYCFEGMNGMAFMASQLPRASPGAWSASRVTTGATTAPVSRSQPRSWVSVTRCSTSTRSCRSRPAARSTRQSPRSSSTSRLSSWSCPARWRWPRCGRCLQGGHQQFQILGASPTWNVALKGSEAMPLLEGVYKGTTPWGGWDTDAPGTSHRASAEETGSMRARTVAPAAVLAGWTWQYPIKALLEQAIAR